MQCFKFAEYCGFWLFENINQVFIFLMDTLHFANMQKKKEQNAILVLQKLKKKLKINSDKQLSEFLNVKPNTISTWKKRNSLDYDIIISICELYDINLNEIFYDSGKRITDNDSNSSETPLKISLAVFKLLHRIFDSFSIFCYNNN